MILYAWETSNDATPLEAAERILTYHRISRNYKPYVIDILQVISSNLTEIDETIRRHARNWKLERINTIDRNILRMGIAEMFWRDDVPPIVAIDEALKQGRKFGVPKSEHFLNGVLDAVRKAGPDAR